MSINVNHRQKKSKISTLQKLYKVSVLSKIAQTNSLILQSVKILGALADRLSRWSKTASELFSDVCFQMYPQIACPIEGKFTLIAFVWLFSTVLFQMFPQINCLKGCIITFVAFLELSPLCVFKWVLRWPAWEDAKWWSCKVSNFGGACRQTF